MGTISLVSCRHPGHVDGRNHRQPALFVAGETQPAAAASEATAAGEPARPILPVSAATPLRPSAGSSGDSTTTALHTETMAPQTASVLDEAPSADGESSDSQPDDQPASPPSSDEEPQMTLDELVSLAVTNNPSISQAAATVGKARGVREQVGLYPNPTIGYSAEEIGAEGSAGMQGAFLSQTIVRGDKLAWNRCVADREVQSLLWQVESQRYRVQNDVRRQFYETLGAEERIKIANELHQIAQAGLETAQELEAALLAAKPDVNQARVQLQEVEIIQRNAAFEYTASWERLAALVGVPHLEPVSLQAILFEEQPVRDRETAWDQINASSPQLQQARADVQQARALISRERVQPIPNLELSAGLRYATAIDDMAASVMLGLPVPLYNANEGNIQRAAAEYHRVTRNVQRLELSLQSQLAERFRQYQQARNTAVTYRDEIVPTEAETLDLIEQAYPLQFDFLRVLTARRDYFEARLQYLEAVIDLRQAEVALDGLLLTGGLDDVPDTNLDTGLRGAALSGQ